MVERLAILVGGMRKDLFQLCLLGGDACVTSFTGYSGYIPQDPSRRERIGELIRKKREGELDLRNPLDWAELAELARIVGIASSKGRQASNELQGVDISFNQDWFDDDVLRIPTSTQFNTCGPDTDSNDDDPDAGYYAYRIALHEAGHALGISNFDYIDLVFTGDQPYEAAHPTIPDSVMNYDSEVPQVTDEPDCSPHPLDVMAIYAIYQVD